MVTIRPSSFVKSYQYVYWQDVPLCAEFAIEKHSILKDLRVHDPREFDSGQRFLVSPMRLLYTQKSKNRYCRLPQQLVALPWRADEKRPDTRMAEDGRPGRA
jgi:hypothetical protein